MEVSLALEPPSTRPQAFTSGQPVRGTATLRIKRREVIQEITVSLTGRLCAAILSSTARRTEDEFPVESDSHKLFKVSYRIFPPANMAWNPQGFALSGGVHSFPFEVRFPTSSACHKHQPGIAHLETALPPSFNFKAPKRQGSATVRYWLRVKVRRKGRYRFNPSKDQELILASTSLVPSPPISRLTEVIVGGQFASLKMVLSPSNTLFTQKPLMLRLFLQPHATLSAITYPIVVQRIGFTIEQTTILNIRQSQASWTSTTDIMHLSGIRCTLPPDGDFMEIDPELWRGAILPDVASTFTTCTVGRRYSLSVTVAFSYGHGGFIQTAGAMADVHLTTLSSHDAMATSLLEGVAGGTRALPMRWGSDIWDDMGTTWRCGETDRSPPPPYM